MRSGIVELTSCCVEYKTTFNHLIKAKLICNIHFFLSLLLVCFLHILLFFSPTLVYNQTEHSLLKYFISPISTLEPYFQNKIPQNTLKIYILTYFLNSHKKLKSPFLKKNTKNTPKARFFIFTPFFILKLSLKSHILANFYQILFFLILKHPPFFLFPMK